jgi:hypothetical protein
MPLPKPSTFTERISSSFKEAMPRELSLYELKKRSTQVTEQLSSAIKDGVPRELSVHQLKKSVRVAALVVLLTPGSIVGLGAAGTYLVNQFRPSQESGQEMPKIPKGLSRERLAKELEILLPKLMGGVAYGKDYPGDLMRHEVELEGQRVKIDVRFDQKGAVVHAPVRVWDSEEKEVVYEGAIDFPTEQDQCFMAQK